MAAPAKPAQAIKKGGTLRWGQVGDLVTIDAICGRRSSNNTLGQVNEMLIDYDDDLKIMPRLAESWEQSTDNTQIKLNLRKGVQFHSGREFTSDDVEYNLLRARDPKNRFAAVVAVGSAWWTSWEKPDKYTIILKSEKPRPGVFDFLQYLRILDKDTMDGPERDDQSRRHRRLQVRRVGARRPHHTRQESQLLGERPPVSSTGSRSTSTATQQAMVAALEAGALDVADLVADPRRRSPEE